MESRGLGTCLCLAFVDPNKQFSTVDVRLSRVPWILKRSGQLSLNSVVLSVGLKGFVGKAEPGGVGTLGWSSRWYHGVPTVVWCGGRGWPSLG